MIINGIYILYAAFHLKKSLYHWNNINMDGFDADEVTRKKMVAYCYDNIINVMNNGNTLPYPSDLPDEEFVALKIYPLPLVRGVYFLKKMINIFYKIIPPITPTK